MCCHSFSMSCGCTGKVWQAWDTINTLWSCSTKPQSTQAVGPEDLTRTAKAPSHPQGGIYWETKNHMPWMYYHPFHMTCRCMYKVWQAWDAINTLESTFGFVLSSSLGTLSPFSQHGPCTRHKWDTIACYRLMVLLPLFFPEQEVDGTPFTTIYTNTFDSKCPIDRIEVNLRCRNLHFGRYHSR